MMPEIKEIREITNTELKELEQVTLPLPKYYSEHYPKDTSIIHDDTTLPNTISPYGDHAALVIAAFGEPSEKYPELRFREKTFLGYYATIFASEQGMSGIEECYPWRKSGELTMHNYYDRIYVPPQFRRNGIAKKLLQSMEKRLRFHGYGNIEVKPDDFLKKWIKLEGFETDSDDIRYGKRL